MSQEVQSPPSPRPPPLHKINRTINLLIKELRQHVEIATLAIAELKQLKNFNSNSSYSDSGTLEHDDVILETLKQNKGSTITCRDFSEYMNLNFKKFTVTEGQLRRISKQYPQVFKIVKTDKFSKPAIVNGKLGFKVSNNSNLKRLSCVCIF